MSVWMRIGLAATIAVATADGLASVLGWEGLRWVGVVLVLAAALRPRGLAPLAGLAIGWLSVATLPEGPLLDGHVVVDGVVAGANVGRSADVLVTRWRRIDGSWQDGGGRVRCTFSHRAPAVGRPVVLRGEAGPIEEVGVLPGAPDPVRAARIGRTRSRIRVRDSTVVGGRGGLFPDGRARHAALLHALATGDRSGVDPEQVKLLRRTGTAHLLAVSGFHVGVVCAAVVMVLLAVRRCLAWLRPRGVPDAGVWGVGVATAASYAWVVGLPVSAQRAVVALAVVGLARVGGRTLVAGDAVGLAAVAVLVVDPAAAATPGFQLSFGAVSGMVLWAPRWLRYLPPDAPRPVRWVCTALAASTAATLGTLPGSAWWFQQVAPVSPVANLLAGPLVGLVVAPAAMLLQFGPQPLRGLAAWVGDHGCDLLFAALHVVDVGVWHPAVGPVGACLLVAGVWSGRLATLGIAVWLALGLRAHPAVPTVTFLDVGQGDAALVEWRDGSRWLVDGGPGTTAVTAWLRRRGVGSVDVVVASHGHPDHIRGLFGVLEAFDVGALWVGHDQGSGELIRVAEDHGIGVRHRPHLAVHPPMDCDRGPNDCSVVLALPFDALWLVMPGDLEAWGEGVVGPVLEGPALVKVPHHGSATSSTDAFIRAVRPSIAVVSAGRRNVYGHPHPGVVTRYRQAGARVLRTDRDGTIQVRFGEEGVEVRGHRAGRGWRRLSAAGLPRPPSGHEEHADRQGGDQEGQPLAGG